MESFSLFALFALFALSLSCVQGQFDLTSLRGSNVTRPFQDRLDAAYSALLEVPRRVLSIDADEPPQNVFTHLYLPGYSPFYTALANFELESRDNTSFHRIASRYFDSTDHRNTSTENITITDAIKDGYAAIRLYQARGDEQFRQVAYEQWNLAYRLTVFQETMFPNGTMAAKEFPVSPDCNYLGSVTSGNGTFRNTSAADRVMGFYESGLSALLAEAEPSDTRYAHAASSSFDFLSRVAGMSFYTLSSTHGLPPDLELLGGSGPECGERKITVLLPERWSMYGVMIEAMSIMHTVTGSNDLGMRLQKTINLTLNAIGDELGPGSNGVLFNGNSSQDDGQNSGDMHYLRGLAEAYKRDEGTLPAELREKMKIVLGVHYNAILDSATTGDNLYSRNWRGPPSQTTFDLYNQAAAAQILVDGITLFNSSDDAPLPSPSPETPSSSKSSTAAITGAAVGSGVFLVLMLLAVFYMVRRWRRKSRTAPSSHFGPTTQVIAPFVATPSDNRSTFPHKYLPPQVQAQEAVPKPPLRRHNSAPSTFREAAGPESPGERHSARLDARDRGGHPREYVHSGGDMEMTPTFPDMVRAVYQRLWAHNGLESPPDYRSDAGELSRPV
ncbi:hypothetical protein PM082_014387 [Marasmius tenuissimus]|nr:hypothetical protein PM082_014387 [Marasmius tenuissimus]